MKQHTFLGPPGTGKTTKLLNVVEGLFDEGFNPNEIAFVSFTKKAATEARDRALEKFDRLDKDDFKLWSTIHSICFKRLMLSRTDVLGRSNWLEIAKQTGFEMAGYYSMDDGLLAGGTLKGDRFLFHCGLAHAKMMTPVAHHATLNSTDRWSVPLKEFNYFIDTLNKYKAATGLVDFNDMLEQAVLTGPVPGVRVAVIDEAQDLSLRQWKVVRSLFANCERIFIAGDDDQSIFEWSGADIDTFLSLEGTQEVLGKSWRLPRTIFDFANDISSRIKRRIEKDWQPNEREGSVTTITSVSELRSLVTENNAESWLLLARNKYLMDEHIGVMQQWGVPYAIKGKPSVKQDDLRAIRAWEALRGDRMISASEAQMMYNYLHGGRDIARGHKTLPDDIPLEVNWDYLWNVCGLDPKKELKSMPWFDVFSNTRLHDNKRDHYRAILRHGYTFTGKPKFNCSTIHGVKGGEADNVIVIDAMARRTYKDFEEVNPDAEHRVQYVGATRAKQNLFILKTGEPQHYPF